MEASLILTYRCNARCKMCHTWQYPSRRDDEFRPALIKKLPSGLKFINITGGEPFLREDINAVLETALTKTRRLVISTNGYYTDRIMGAAEAFGNRIGFRISLEGLPATNDRLRGLEKGFEHGLRSLLMLQKAGLKDLGFGITVSDENATDLIDLFHLSESMDMEFATAVVHNSFYFHINDNKLAFPQRIADALERLAVEMLRSRRPKNWFRAYFNMGLANRVKIGPRPLPCSVGYDVFFLDPFGNILPCNGSKTPLIMGNLHEQDFTAIWHGQKAKRVRQSVKTCLRQCWMIGSAAPAMKRHLLLPSTWIFRNKWRLFKNSRRKVNLEPVADR